MILLSLLTRITREWWDWAIINFDVYISEAVIDEISAGDPVTAKQRIYIVSSFKRLELTEDVRKMAKIYIDKLEIPPKSALDTIHIAIAAVHSLDYLVTWNCSHNANGIIIKKLIEINTVCGVKTPVICTPEELME